MNLNSTTLGRNINTPWRTQQESVDRDHSTHTHSNPKLINSYEYCTLIFIVTHSRYERRRPPERRSTSWRSQQTNLNNVTTASNMASKGRTKHLTRNQKLAAKANTGVGTKNLEEDARRGVQREDFVSFQDIFLNFRASSMNRAKDIRDFAAGCDSFDLGNEDL